ncbi:MAG: hypothetical protein R6U61_00115 [Thermoplasmata archaeon]
MRKKNERNVRNVGLAVLTLVAIFTVSVMWTSLSTAAIEPDEDIERPEQDIDPYPNPEEPEIKSEPISMGKVYNGNPGINPPPSPGIAM